MKRLSSIIILAALTGCANVEFSRDNSTQTLTYTDAAGKAHLITGFIGYGGWNEKMLTVNFDGQPAITGNLDSNATGTLGGSFGGTNALAYCSGQGRGFPTLGGYRSYAVTCQIQADGKPIGTLNF